METVKKLKEAYHSGYDAVISNRQAIAMSIRGQEKDLTEADSLDRRVNTTQRRFQNYYGRLGKFAYRLGEFIAIIYLIEHPEKNPVTQEMNRRFDN